LSLGRPDDAERALRAAVTTNPDLKAAAALLMPDRFRPQ
jgi:hypothetical protein